MPAASMDPAVSAADLRAFLAVETTPAIHAELARLKRTLAAAGADVRWVGDDGLHVTVKFLGRVAPAALAALRSALVPALAAHVPIPARVHGLGVFPTRRRPRVVWVGVTGGGLNALAQTVEAAAAACGFPPEARPFQPHITLGRVRGPRGAAQLDDALQAHWNDDFGHCVIRELIAYRSDLRPAGAVYTKLWTAPLGGPSEGDPHDNGC